MPNEVAREVLQGGVPRGEGDMRVAIADGWLRLWVAPVPALQLPDLDEGEAACIRIASVCPKEALLLMDERAGRAVAGELGINVAGTAAIIGMAKLKGLIPSARQVFEVLHGSAFRISAEVIQTILARVGEPESE